MKAVTWRGLLPLAACLLSLAAAGPAARANAPGLPADLPALPALGELMQRDLRTGLAINGFDPVSYRLGGKPEAGLATYELMQDGIVWRFASQANLEAFRDAPAIYAPAFAGFDPTGVADGVAVDSDPSQFAIVGSRLFLFRTAENRRRFLQNAGMLAQAEGRWSSVLRFVAR
ncbi:YHS domain-containing (seleno)protein [Bosea sp. BH3]|uniref:YHS domain-containing (seleno)protein n=1 Tax=Bosea sp. BH3 TaxID=2871701 RepID=UPI0021CB443D|nr:YHS domain-containing (seleno)protein [Bosea sp. BH3]